MSIINLTPHAVTFVTDVGDVRIVVEPSGSVARVAAETERTGEIDGIPISRTVYGGVEGLPEKQDGIVYIVSSIVAQRVPDRDDVFIPNESVRDDKGRIIGCKSLGRV